jgi:hypothetical protein
MKLKLRRSQKSGLTGSVTFKLFFIVDLDGDEAAALKKYKFGKLIIYETPKGAAASSGMRAAAASGGIGDMGRGFASAMAAKALNQILSVNDMVDGKEVVCKDITEMIAAEEQIKDACQSLSRILYMCRHFDGEEIIDIEPFQAEA